MRIINNIVVSFSCLIVVLLSHFIACELGGLARQPQKQQQQYYSPVDEASTPNGKPASVPRAQEEEISDVDDEAVQEPPYAQETLDDILQSLLGIGSVSSIASEMTKALPKVLSTAPPQETIPTVEADLLQMMWGTFLASSIGVVLKGFMRKLVGGILALFTCAFASWLLYGKFGRPSPSNVSMDETNGPNAVQAGERALPFLKQRRDLTNLAVLSTFLRDCDTQFTRKGRGPFATPSGSRRSRRSTAYDTSSYNILTIKELQCIGQGLNARGMTGNDKATLIGKIVPNYAKILQSFTVTQLREQVLQVKNIHTGPRTKKEALVKLAVEAAF